jgi:pimeloyl-ACP methyl ester carboxylesterase
MVTTRYARSGEVNIAYQVVGSGERDLVYVPGWVSNIEVMWEDPGLARFLNRLASFSRLITFDKRGTGLSDPVPVEDLPTLEVRMDDLRAVMDAVGSERATLFGHSEGGNMCALFAATFPVRTDALVLAGVYAARLRSDEYPWAPTLEERTADIEALERTWGDPGVFDYLVPSRASDRAFQSWLERYQRLSASPRAAAALMTMNTQINVTSVLPSIRVPTLLLYRVDDHDVKIEEGRYIASMIPNSKLVELPGADHGFWGGDTETLLEEIEEFVTGHRGTGETDRVLATVLFTDIVDSTKQAAGLGDWAWRNLLDRHHAMVRAELARWRGKEIDTAGDGFFATFDGPARAIRCARAVADGVGSLGIAMRCGLHTGEVETRGNDVSGLAVHIGARIAGLAGAGEVLVSRTVKDLVAGAGFEFRDRGSHELKGVPDRWDVYEVLT